MGHVGFVLPGWVGFSLTGEVLSYENPECGDDQLRQDSPLAEVERVREVHGAL